MRQKRLLQVRKGCTEGEDGTCVNQFQTSTTKRNKTKKNLQYDMVVNNVIPSSSIIQEAQRNQTQTEVLYGVTLTVADVDYRISKVVYLISNLCVTRHVTLLCKQVNIGGHSTNLGNQQRSHCCLVILMCSFFGSSIRTNSLFVNHGSYHGSYGPVFGETSFSSFIESSCGSNKGDFQVMISVVYLFESYV